MKNVIMYKDGQNSWVRYIKKRIDNNLNLLALLEGPTGIGKSWTGIQIAYEIDSEFDPSCQVAFSFSELMTVINKFNHKPKDGQDDTLYKKKYKVVIFDEAQTSINKRDWQSRVSKLFLFLLSTFRHQNIIVLFTSPFSDFMDSASMKLIHVTFECKGWSSKTQLSHVRPKLLQWNGKVGKFYNHSLYVIRDGKISKLVNWHIKCPPKELTDPYEEKKLKFTMKLNEQITKELYEMEHGKDEDKVDDRKDLTDRQEEVLKCVAKFGTQVQAAKHLGVNVSAVNHSINQARKKGYKVKEFIVNT